MVSPMAWEPLWYWLPGQLPGYLAHREMVELLPDLQPMIFSGEILVGPVPSILTYTGFNPYKKNASPSYSLRYWERPVCRFSRAKFDRPLTDYKAPRYGERYCPDAVSADLRRHNEVASAARAACKGSLVSLARGCVGRISLRPLTARPAISIQESNAARVRRCKCSATSDSSNQPSPPGSRCPASPLRNPRSMRLSGSYTACSSGELGRAGTHGGLQTMSGARPGGNRFASTISTISA